MLDDIFEEKKQLRNHTSDDLDFGVDRTPYTWGVSNLDSKLGKPNKGDLVVMLGYPGMGKSEFSFFVAEANQNKENKVAYITLELSKKQLLQRKARKKVGVKYTDYQDANYETRQMEKMQEKLNEYKQMEYLEIIGASETPTIEEVKEKCQECKRKGYDMIFLDNLGKIDNCATDIESQARVTSELQTLKNELDLCIILIHHLRKPNKGDIYKPGGSMAFSGSQKIQDNCTIMLEVRRDTDPYNNDPKVKAEVKIIQYKHTWDGIVGEQIIYFDKGKYFNSYQE